MRGTGSTRTATRWRWCETGRAAAALLVLLVAGCTQLAFTPSPGWSRLTPGGLRTEGDAMLRAECPRLVNRRPTGEARMSLTLDSAAAVTQAVIERGTGDARVDDIFGRLAVRLQFAPVAGSPPAGQTIGATMGYSCAPSGAAITFALRQPSLPERAPADTSTAPPPG